MKINKKNLIIFVLVFCVCSYVGASVSADDNTTQFCESVYIKTKECPQAVCRLECVGGLAVDDCEKVCYPKECAEIDAESCPLDSCQILKGCSGEDVCYHKLINEPFECGNISYAGQKVECCYGLVKRCGERFFDGTCDMIGANTLYSVPICIPCGNGICNQFEDSCNCPEDCS
ncbi:MAG: hypothetical protein KKD07_00060 [Candidatus Omnitrophica bacterium]|nr:hypothetical protein [Candidatus Omnitrophota bacterium]MBU1996306.1 hypothetical protein [Candidatus Omnitrophota bacterium]MBU4332815.1 hypothetical protein [Candidatus Omnitrophota bacterium]